MLFMVTQVHTPETCPKDEGGANTLIDTTVEGVKVIGRWGAWSHHIIWYLVESDSTRYKMMWWDQAPQRPMTFTPSTVVSIKVFAPPSSLGQVSGVCT